MRQSARAGLAGIVLLAVAGCGGGSSAFTLTKTRDCLADNPGLQIRSEVDFVASTALGGAFNVRFPDNQVTIAFGDGREGAKRLTEAYKRFKGPTIGLEDVLRVERNAVMLWEAHPEEEYLATIHDCLE